MYYFFRAEAKKIWFEICSHPTSDTKCNSRNWYLNYLFLSYARSRLRIGLSVINVPSVYFRVTT